MTSGKKDLKTNLDFSEKLQKTGLILLALSFLGFVFVYFPVISKEVGFFFFKPDATKEVSVTYQGEEKKVIVAADKDFSLVIPKIGANSKVIKDVDPTNPQEYQVKLALGVAHAKNTALPGEFGNSFYFAHSSDNFYNANRYNSVFYLLPKLEVGDRFYLVFNKTIYTYEVFEKKIVGAQDLQYMESDLSKKTATLMTCWPAGTTFKRYVVTGELVGE